MFEDDLIHCQQFGNSRNCPVLSTVPGRENRYGAIESPTGQARYNHKKCVYPKPRSKNHTLAWPFTQSQCADQVQAPITGRISVVVPFFPFTKGEQAVVLHKSLLDLGDELRQPINLKEKKVVGHGDLSIQKDGQLCTSLAQKWYDIDTGARSLLRGVEQDVEVPLAERYCMSDTKVSEEMNKGPLQKYTVQLWSVEDSPAKVSVIQDGETLIVHNAPSVS